MLCIFIYGKKGDKTHLTRVAGQINICKVFTMSGAINVSSNNKILEGSFQLRISTSCVKKSGSNPDQLWGPEL